MQSLYSKTGKWYSWPSEERVMELRRCFGRSGEPGRRFGSGRIRSGSGAMGDVEVKMHERIGWMICCAGCILLLLVVAMPSIVLAGIDVEMRLNNYGYILIRSPSKRSWSLIPMT